MFSEIAIKVDNLSKCYQIYNQPHDRLKQSIYPRLQRLFGKKPRQYFREFWALKDVSFEIKRGETVGIIGRNGSGKSTLLQMICGTLNPSSGSIRTNGRIAALLELGSGFNPEFTGRENVFMNAAILGLSAEETTARFNDIIAFADIGDFIEQPVKTYSSGMMVRLAFAVIAHVDADILVIDEALAVGDAFFTQKCMRFLRSFMKTGTVLFVSHDTASVINLCDRAIWLDHGIDRKNGAAKDVCEEYLNCIFAASSQQMESAPEQNDDTVRLVRVGSAAQVWRDQRSDLVNASPFRNDIEIFKFTQETDKTFGGQEAQIVNVLLLDSKNHPLAWVIGGERVNLRIEATANTSLDKPIFGFFVKDRLGQTLFGDNTYLSHASKNCQLQPSDTICAEFEFYMPWLAQGDYVIQVAIANGTQEEHKQLHWVHDALAFRSVHSPISTGLIGIPMLNIQLNKIETQTD